MTDFRFEYMTFGEDLISVLEEVREEPVDEGYDPELDGDNSVLKGTNDGPA